MDYNKLTDDDSDVDLVTDYLNSNLTLNNPDSNTTKKTKKPNVKTSDQQQNQQQIQGVQQQQQQQQHNIPSINAPNIGNNMVPIISVTPHSPGAKYYSILEDSLKQLENIRENVVQMKNSIVQIELNNSSRSSSLPSVYHSAESNSVDLNCSALTFDSRRKSWTANEDLTECTKSSYKSISLSSLDSEEQESIRAAERHRTSRNSTGGISTHSLNEAELAGDFEGISAKRNLAPSHISLCTSRISLKKSISTPSIAPLRIPCTKEENKITIVRHLSDSEDENHDDTSARDKIEPYDDHTEKRRKRGSLFFRKKKDKTKTKGQSTTICDTCGATINLSSNKEHSTECKSKVSKQQSSKTGTTKKNSANSHSTHHDDSRDYYDGHSQNENYSDDTPLIRGEFLNEPQIGPHDLGADPILGIEIEEHDSWSPSVPKEIVKLLKDKQVKKQEHIYEFIMTEKHHCQTLLVMQKIFVEGLQRHFSRLKIDGMFPRLAELTDLHINFLKNLRLRQKENCIVNSITDILLDFFSPPSAHRLKSAYGEFCSNYRSALDKHKYCMDKDDTFVTWHKHCVANPLLKKKGIPECILFVTQRLTKYPLLIDPLIKSSKEDPVEQEKLEEAKNLVKGILYDVNARVEENEKQDRQVQIFKCIDVKSFAMYKNKQFRKSDIGVGTHRKLKFEGYATLMQGRSKMQNVLVVVLSDCLFFLQENSHNRYTFFTPENKAGVVPLRKLLIREKAGTESRGIYIISSNPLLPEMYELKIQNPKDKDKWIKSIRAAVLDCPADDCETDDLTVEEKQKLINAKQANIREMIEKLRQKDIEQAVLLEDKILLQLSLVKERKNVPESSIPSAEEFLERFGSYKDVITNDCDTVEIWERVLNSIQKVRSLASSLYTAATGLPVSRSTSSVGEKHSDAFFSPTLPKRAETFGGFDERRNKSNIPWRDAVLSTLPITPLPSHHHHHNHNHLQGGGDSVVSRKTSATSSSSLGTSSCSGTIINENPGNSCCGSNSNISNVMRINSDNISLKDNNYAALQISHNLHTLLCIISQQMTLIEDLKSQLAAYRGNKTVYKHNDQLEELRNLQDKLQAEKHLWLKQKEQKEKEFDEIQKELELQQKQIKAEQDDIAKQREQLYRKMELLSNQGILISPNSPLPIATNNSTSAAAATATGNEDASGVQNSDEHYQTTGTHTENNFGDRRKEKRRTPSIPKIPPVNLLSATNAPKVNQASIKQQIPMKLSSLSSTKSDKALNCSNTITSQINASGGITQMLPLKLADKKTNQNITPNHSRTGSSPAIIQQPTQQQTGNPATRTNTYPKLPERYRLRTSDVGLTMQSPITSLSGQQNQFTTNNNNISNLTSSSSVCYPTRNSSMYASLTTASNQQQQQTSTTISPLSTTQQQQQQQQQQKSQITSSSNRISSPSLISSAVTAAASIASSSSGLTSTVSGSAITVTAVANNDTKQQQQQQTAAASETDEEEIYF